MDSTASERVIVVGKRKITDYLIEIAVLFQEAPVVVLKGEGRFISKAVDLYNAVMSRMGESVELLDVSIGSSSVEGRIRPYILIKIKRR
ncbi:MAG: DNA-binding protein [Desulfurococcaceae archaeon]|jgi:DNA-binding protein Alba